jgi:hypothetical protein
VIGVITWGMAMANAKEARRMANSIVAWGDDLGLLAVLRQRTIWE